MKTKYQRWITENVEGDGHGRCREITEAMAKIFPELIRVHGKYYCPILGYCDHWWLRDGEFIVDPTKAQFPSKGLGAYVIETKTKTVDLWAHQNPRV